MIKYWNINALVFYNVIKKIKIDVSDKLSDQIFLKLIHIIFYIKN